MNEKWFNSLFSLCWSSEPDQPPYEHFSTLRRAEWSSSCGEHPFGNRNATEARYHSNRHRLSVILDSSTYTTVHEIFIIFDEDQTNEIGICDEQFGQNSFVNSKYLAVLFDHLGIMFDRILHYMNWISKEL